MEKISLFFILCTTLSIMESKAEVNSTDNTTSPEMLFVSVAKCPGNKYHLDEILIPPHFRVKGQNDTLTIRLTPEQSLDHRCPGGKVLSVSVPLKDGKPPNGSVPIRFLSSGMVSISHSYYPTDQYCFSRFDTQHLTLSHCKIACAPYGPTLCIPKCCPLSEVIRLKEGSHGCVPVGGNISWSPRIYSSSNVNLGDRDTQPLTPEMTPALHFKHVRLVGEIIPITYRAVNDTDSFAEEGTEYLNEIDGGTPFRLLDNGSLLTLNPEPEMTRPGECGEIVLKLPLFKRIHCLDGLIVGDETVFEGTELDQIAFVPSVTEDESITNTVVKAIVVSIGVVFLALTLIMYIIIWPKHNIHGWTVFSFVLSMLIFFITLAIVHITHLTTDLSILNTRSCVTVAILGHFTFLCALSWMSVMNFNFWATFRIMSPSQERHKGVTRYLRYFCFAVGLPSLIVGISLILHFTLGHTIEYEDNHHGLLPGYGTTKCQLHPCSLKYYLYIPMACLLGFNLVMFSWTVFTLWTYKQKAQTGGSGGGNRQNQSWVLFCKLFLVMGISWVFEVLSGFLNWDFIYFDVINLCQAIGIFFIFTAKRENLLWIYKRYGFSKRFVGPILRWKLCYVAELDCEQTEMTSAEKNRTLTTLNKFRISSGSDN